MDTQGTPQRTEPTAPPNKLAAGAASDLRVFEQRDIHAAYQHAAAGGQALHLIDGRFAYRRSDTPSCFKGRGQIAHLFDQDRERLVRTVTRFGVRVIRVEREGTHRQHIDLCGKPLERALDQAKPAATGDRTLDHAIDAAMNPIAWVHTIENLEYRAYRGAVLLCVMRRDSACADWIARRADGEPLGHDQYRHDLMPRVERLLCSGRGE